MTKLGGATKQTENKHKKTQTVTSCTAKCP